MSDLLFAASNPEDKYGAAILEFVTMLRYTVDSKHTHGKLVTIWVKEKRKQKRSRVQIPAAYYEHMKRFLWRYYLLSALYETWGSGPKKVTLPEGTTFLATMVIMMDTVVEQLLIQCRKCGENVPYDLRCTLFDMYLTTEFIVGRHDGLSVDQWRRAPENVDKDLEQIDPFTLDWKLYETCLGDSLGGRRYDWDIGKVGKKDLFDLLDAVSQWFGIRIRTQANWSMEQWEWGIHRLVLCQAMLMQRGKPSQMRRRMN